MADKLRNGSVQ